MSGSVWPTPIGRLERDVSSTLARTSLVTANADLERPRRRAKGAIESRYPGQEVDYAGVSRLSRGREKIQIPQASPARAIQHDSGAVSREMGIGAGLSDGGAELCRRSFAPGQT